MTANSTPSRLVRFLAHGSAAPQIGEPVDASIDVGLAVSEGRQVLVNVYSGQSVLSPSERTGEQVAIGKLLSPLDADEVGTVRCIGLNYVSHAEECSLAIPSVPTVFLKPATAVAAPCSDTLIPKSFVPDDAADYESEVALVIGRDCKNVSESDALQYLYGITASNDISSRAAQFAQSQWCYSKGFDGSCPLGPAVVLSKAIDELGNVQIEGKLNGKIVQKSDLNDLIFSIPKIISFLSQGTTLPKGTVILTGTPAGIGWTSSPRRTLKHADQFQVSVSHGVGTLVNSIVFEN